MTAPPSFPSSTLAAGIKPGLATLSSPAVALWRALDRIAAVPLGRVPSVLCEGA